jgi:hypothetical protein
MAHDVTWVGQCDHCRYVLLARFQDASTPWMPCPQNHCDTESRVVRLPDPAHDAALVAYRMGGPTAVMDLLPGVYAVAW